MNLGDCTLIFWDCLVTLARSVIFVMSGFCSNGLMETPFLSTQRVYSNSVPRCRCCVIWYFFYRTRSIHFCQSISQLRAYLKHVCPHGLVKAVDKGLVFKLEFHLVVVIPHLILDYEKEHLDCAFWDRLFLPWLAELNPIAAGTIVEIATYMSVFSSSQSKNT